MRAQLRGSDGRDEVFTLTQHAIPRHSRTQARTLGAVAAGGVVGTSARYAIVLAFPPVSHGFPWTTFAVNASGAFVLGVLSAVLARLPAPPSYLRPFLGTGILGSYTTFSAFAVDADVLLRSGRPGVAATYTAGSVAAGLAAATFGAVVARGPGQHAGS